MDFRDPRITQGLASLATAVIVIFSWNMGYKSAEQALTRDRNELSHLSSRITGLESVVR